MKHLAYLIPSLLVGCSSDSFRTFSSMKFFQLVLLTWVILIFLAMFYRDFSGRSGGPIFIDVLCTFAVAAIFFIILFYAGALSTIWPPFPDIIETQPVIADPLRYSI